MKYRFFSVLAALAMLAVGCQRDDPPAPDPDAGRIFPSKEVNMTVTGGDSGEEGEGTRSVITINETNVGEVALFVFDKDGKIMLKSKTEPYAVRKESNSFEWALPYDPSGKALEAEIYAFCNYTSNGLDLSSHLKDVNLEKSTLDALTFGIRSVDELKKVKSMPMAGVKSLSLTKDTEGVSIDVDKLFAVYHIKFDLKEVKAAGYNIDALHLTTHNVNSSEHWIRPKGGDKAASTVDNIDRAEGQELELMETGADAYVYVLENMQGLISGAKSWTTVQTDLGEKVGYCTYLDLSVKVNRSDRSYQNTNFQIYLGDGADFKSSFNVPRNYRKSVTIKIPVDGVVNPSSPVFTWDDSEATVESGASITPGFKYDNASLGNISIVPADDRLTVSDIVLNNDGTGTCKLTAASGWDGGEVIVLGMAKKGNDVVSQDDLKVTVTKRAPVEETRYRYEVEPSSETINVGDELQLSVRRFADKYVDGELSQKDNEGEVMPASGFNWTSVNPAYVSVGADGKIKGLQAIRDNMVKATVKGDNDSYAIANITVVDVTTVTYELVISPKESTVKVGETQSYTVTRKTTTTVNGNSTTKEETVTADCSWTSDKTSVATVSGGKATAKAEGTAKITAQLKIDGSVYSAYATLKVNDNVTTEERFEIEPKTSTINVGGTAQFRVMRYFDTYTNGSLTAKGTQGDDFTSNFSWSTADATVATAGSDGKVKGLKATSGLTVNAVYKNNKDVKLTGTVIINSVKETRYRYTMEPSNAEIYVNETQQFDVYKHADEYTDNQLTKEDETGTKMSASDFNWSTSNSAKASVTNGLVKGLQSTSGLNVTATLKSDSKVSATGEIVVKDKVEEKVTYEMDPSYRTIYVGETQQFNVYKVTETITNGKSSTTRTMMSAAEFTWSTSNSSYATVSAKGLATGVRATSSSGITVRAKKGNIVVNADLVVQDHISYTYELAINPDESEKKVGETQSYTVTKITYKSVNGGIPTKEGNGEDVTASCTWKSDKTTVATVSKGTATAKAVGTAKITATLKIDGENYSATATLTVKAKDPVVTTEDTYILYPENDVTIFVGGTQTYKVMRHRVTTTDGVSDGGVDTDVTSDFTISSSNTSVATMSGATATGKDWEKTTISAKPKSGTASGTLSRILTVKHKFDWGTPSKTTVAPGEEISVPYTTTLESEVLTFEGADNVKPGSSTCKVTIPSNASDGSLTVYGGKKGINPEAWDSFTVTVKKPAAVTLKSMVITEMTDNGYTIFEPSRYRFKCVVTLSDGKVFDSTKSSDREYFTWDSRDLGSDFVKESDDDHDSVFEVVDILGSYYSVDCFFKYSGISGTEGVTIYTKKPTYEVKSVDGERFQKNVGGYDYLRVKVVVNELHDSKFYKAHTVYIEEGTVKFKTYTFDVRYDELVDGSWTGSNGNKVKSGASARFYIQGVPNMSGSTPVSIP